MAPCEAMVFWQWMNFALAAAPEGRPPLVVNMDETSLVRHANGLVGTVVKNGGGNKVGDKAASLAARRSCMTLMAAITHDTAVQPKLPQVLIGNKHQLTAQVLRDAKPLPHNIHVFKEETAWNNHAVMRKIYISFSESSWRHGEAALRSSYFWTFTVRTLTSLSLYMPGAAACVSAMFRP